MVCYLHLIREEDPNFDSAWMIHIGKPPYELFENTFPWEARSCKNGKQVFNVPTRCSNP